MMATSLYETDLYAWSQQQVELLQAEEWDKIDWRNITEEIDALGASQRNELRNRLKILILHLLKWQFQPGRQSKSWRASIDEQRSTIEDLLDDNPSLRRLLHESVAIAYPRAVRDAHKQTSLPKQTFPVDCPYTLEQLLDEVYYPTPK
jgi:hypothetical protein